MQEKWAMRKKWAWRVFASLLAVGTFFNIIPSNWKSAMDGLTTIDVWIINNAAYPSLFALAVGLVLGTWIIPDAWGLIRTAWGKQTPGDSEIVRRNILFIKERLTSHEQFEKYADEYYKRIEEVNDSDSIMFVNERLNQFRRDFVNRAGIVAWEKTHPSRDRHEEMKVKMELLEIWQRFDNALSKQT